VERVDDVVTTDFMKCVELVRVRDQQPDPTASSTISTGSPEQVIQEHQGRLTTPLGVVALGGTGGRFDQSMSSIHYLYILNQERQATLISDESVIIVLETVSFVDVGSRWKKKKMTFRQLQGAKTYAHISLFRENTKSLVT